MLHRAGWALAIGFLLSCGAAAQQPTEKIPAPLPLNQMEQSAGEPLRLEASRTIPAIYADADFLLWRVKHGPAPELLTTAPNNGITINGLTGGILGEPGTQVLFTGRDIEYGNFWGVRAKAGVHLGTDGFWSFEAGGFLLQKRDVDFSAASNGNGTPLLTIPFLDAATGRMSSLDVNSQDIAFNPYLNGNIRIHSDIAVWGVEGNFVAHSIRTAAKSVDVVVGFRHLSLNENLTINQSIVPARDGNISLQFPTVGQGSGFYHDVLANTPVFINDRFGTRNQFYGPQVGGRFSWVYDRFTADLNLKVALGVTHQQVSIDGSSTALFARDPNTQAVVTNLTTRGGVFALQNNIGNYTQNPFTVAPEIGFNVKYELTSWLQVHLGYSALYWSNVARPGSQIDATLNSKLVPTGALLPTNSSPSGSFVVGSEQGRPYFTFRDSAFWAHGVNFGLEFRY